MNAEKIHSTLLHSQSAYLPQRVAAYAEWTFNAKSCVFMPPEPMPTRGIIFFALSVSLPRCLSWRLSHAVGISFTVQEY